MNRPNSNQTSTTTNHLFAYSVEEYDAGNGKKQKSWTRIGVAFPHKDGPGLSVQLRALPLDGRIVLLPPDEGASGGERSSPR
jgi:hypothetical protein